MLCFCAHSIGRLCNLVRTPAHGLFPEAPLRIAVLTGLRQVERTAWWSALTRAANLEAIILCGVAGQAARESSLRSPRSSVLAGGVPVERLGLDLSDSDDIAQLRAWRPALGIVIGDIRLPAVLRDLPSLGCIQVHGGVSSSGDRRWATSVVTRLSADPSADQERILSASAPITRADSLADIEARIEELGQLVLRRVLENPETGWLRGGAVAARGGDLPFRPARPPGLRARLSNVMRRARPLANPRRLAKSVAAITILVLAAPARNLLRTLRRRHPVRVFTFHRVSSLCRDGMTVAPTEFRRQLRYLARTHTVLPLGKCLELARTRARLARPVAAITFDDGYRSVYTNALPIMQEEGLRGACFVSTDLVGTSRRFPHDAALPVIDLLEVMDWSELSALRAEGWEIGGHTATHARLSQCDGAMLKKELEEPLTVLEQRLGIAQPALAYPFGGQADISAAAVDCARRAGYSACLSDFGGENHPPFDSFDVRRIELGGDHASLSWKTRVHGMDVGGLRLWAARRPRPARVWQGAQSVNA